MKPSTAYFSIGSNIGNAYANCKKVISGFKSDSAVRLVDHSGYYLTAPQEFADQPWFINAAGRLETLLDPFELLAYFKKIESDSGRDFSARRFGPRIIDIDIIFYDDLVIDSAELIIPHQKMHSRKFVLKPLSEIAPDYIHPVLGRSVMNLLEETEKNDKQGQNQDVVPFYDMDI